MAWKNNIMMIQISFSAGLNLDLKQLIIAQIQNINKSIINKNTKTMIHIGKNTNLKNTILQHNIGFQPYF